MPYLLKPAFQTYQWGSREFIQGFCGITELEDSPLAEMWLGAHPHKPSLILTENGELPLDSFLALDPIRHLGKATAFYKDKLPFLLKVLAAQTPLSIQVHPDKQTAEEGFAAENLAGIPLNDSRRSFKDDNHKPELIMAITPFLMMRGFRKYAEIIGIFDSLKISKLWQSFAEFSSEPSPDHLKQLFSQILSSTNGQLEELLSRIIQAKSYQNAGLSFICEVIEHLNRHFPLDSGIASPLLLNTLTLRKGEAIYLDAGIPHAYIQGAGIELMANSDNVIRAGLTNKHIDRELLLKVADFSPSAPEVQALNNDAKHTSFYTPFDELQLEVFRLNGVDTWKHPERPAILLCLEGKLTINDNMEIGKGRAVFVSAGEADLKLLGKAELLIATIPH